MKRYAIVLQQRQEAPYEAMARFFSIIAYPHDQKSQDRAWKAMCRFAIESRMDDVSWSAGRRFLRPAHFSLREKQHRSDLKKIEKLMLQRREASHAMVLPAIGNNALNSKFPRRRHAFERQFKINDQALQLVQNLGWKGDSASTAKSKIWKPTRPVVHLVLGWVMWCHVNKVSISWQELLWNEDSHSLSSIHRTRSPLAISRTKRKKL